MKNIPKGMHQATTSVCRWSRLLGLWGLGRILGGCVVLSKLATTMNALIVHKSSRTLESFSKYLKLWNARRGFQMPCSMSTLCRTFSIRKLSVSLPSHLGSSPQSHYYVRFQTMIISSSMTPLCFSAAKVIRGSKLFILPVDIC